MRCKYCHNRDTWDLDGGREISVEELMKEVVSYRHFMNATGGGVTASGGEAILQAEFVRDWFRACKAEGINTCLDTNGFVRHYDHIIDELLDVTDLVLQIFRKFQRPFIRYADQILVYFVVQFF